MCHAYSASEGLISSLTRGLSYACHEALAGVYLKFSNALLYYANLFCILLFCNGPEGKIHSWGGYFPGWRQPVKPISLGSSHHRQEAAML